MIDGLFLYIECIHTLAICSIGFCVLVTTFNNSSSCFLLKMHGTVLHAASSPIGAAQRVRSIVIRHNPEVAGNLAVSALVVYLF